MSTKNTVKDNIGEVVKKFSEALKNPKTTMTKEKLIELKKKVAESLSNNRRALIMKEPFIGGILMKFDLIPVRDYRCNTAMTDGSRIYFDIDFYKNLTEEERVFVLAHECWHCVYMHFLRQGKRIPTVWNIATDCEINYMLKGQNFNPPKELCFPEPGDEGKNAEDIYEHLIKKMKNEQKRKNKKGNESDDGGQSSDGNGNSDNDQKPSKDNGKGGKNDKNTKNGKGKLSGQFDKHLNEDDGDDEENGGGDKGNEKILPTDEWGEKGEDSDFSPRVDQGFAEKMRESIISEAQKIERRQGTLPGGLSSILEKLRKPEISWKQLLATEMTRVFCDKKTWLPPSRRHVHEEMYFQSSRGERITCTVCVDTSGSCTADLPKFMGEVTSLLNSFSNYDMEFIQCDADIQSIEHYDEYNQFPLEDCSKIEFKGFGGSDFTPVFKHFEESGEYPNIAIFFTDGYITVPEDPPPFEVLWILTSDGNDKLCDWGRKIMFKEKREE